MLYYLTALVQTTQGPHSNTSEEPMEWGEMMDNLAGLRAAVGEDNLLAVNIVVA